MDLTNTLGLSAGLSLSTVVTILTIGVKLGMVVTADQLEAKLAHLKTDMSKEYVTHQDLQELKNTINERIGRVEEQIDQLGNRILDAIARKA